MINKLKKLKPIKGIKLSSISSGMYKKKRLDLSLMEISDGSSIAGVFTINKGRSDTINISEKNLKKTNPKFIIVNSGNANAGTGKEGFNDIIKYSKVLANIANCKIEDILVFSTGIIGERIKYKNIIESLPSLNKNLSDNGWEAFSKSILTTDTTVKKISKTISLSGKKINISGVTKGSGMIMPNMATMLSFVATDIKISKSILIKILKKITEKSFNMITVDGETSTNDASILISTGKSSTNFNNLKKNEKDLFLNTLENIYKDLAKMIVKDGEGATKFITINVKNTATFSDAKKIAMSIAKSPLVKTAIFAEDPNWGRILSAIGNVQTKVKDLSKIEIYIGNFLVFKDNQINKNYVENRVKKYLKNDNVDITIKYNGGKESATVWTTDLTYEYIKINAEYRT